MAALLACGDSAVLSHRSAAALWDLAPGPVRPVELIVAGDGGRTQPGLRTHRMHLESSDFVVLDGLRVTTPARTIADLAARLKGRDLRRLVERAQDLRRFDATALHAHLSSRPRRPGSAALRDLLALIEPDADGARSHLERLFLRLVRRAGLPEPEVNVRIGRASRDFAWTAQQLAVEVDGGAYHSSSRARRRDNRRDRGLAALGWRTARFTYEEVALAPEEVARQLRDLLATGRREARGR
jgi:very-short-patch-repair endonuclease